MQHIEAKMHHHLLTAMARRQHLSRIEKKAAGLKVREIITLKYQLETLAAQKGYSKRCKDSLPVCHGDCCKWFFPRNLTPVDFLVAIFHMPEDQQAGLAEQISSNKNKQCPVLLNTGCFLSFEQRPVLCTNAYPCFNDRSYWIEKEKQNTRFKAAMESLGAIVRLENGFG